MRKGSGGRWLCALVLVLCVAFASAGSAQTQGNSLTIQYDWDGLPLVGAEFSLWRVADVSDGLIYTPVGAFAGYGLDFEGHDAAQWRDSAMTLATYAARDKIAAEYTGKTGSGGTLKLDGLADGLYLFVGKVHGQGDYRYTCEPGLVLVPAQQEDGDSAEVVIVSPKKERVKVGPVDLGVRKEWSDDGHESERPDKIAVQLLRNGSVYDTVVLSEDNSWQHAWQDLEGGPQWWVVEKNPPEKYDDGYRRDGNTFVVTNTYREPSPDKPKDETLPQTGLLWWPVPVLAGAGMALCYMGWRRQKNSEEE